MIVIHDGDRQLKVCEAGLVSVECQKCFQAPNTSR